MFQTVVYDHITTYVFSKSIPDVSQEDIYWRIHFTCDAMIHSSCHHKELTKLSSGLCKMDFESALKRLIDYAAAGIVVKS